MKHFLSLALIVLSGSQLFAQGTILSLDVYPANPTVDDNIEIHASVQFTYGDCQVEDLNHSVNGFNIVAYAHHCVGFLTVICPTTDTFQIGQLPAANYTFDFTLTSGFGSPNCSPGIVPDGNDQLQFTVSPSVGIDEITINPNFAFPNPVQDVLFFKSPLKEPAFVTDIHGKQVLELRTGETRTDMKNLPSGIYFLRTETKRFKFVKD